MSEPPNPFLSPELAYRDLIPQDQQHLKKHAQKLAVLRANPPTILGSLGNWRMLVMLLGGLLLTFLAGWTFRDIRHPYNTYAPVIVGSIFLGACLRDISYIVRIVRGWSLAAHFIDWNKVDAFR
jgi:hypothetical protein